VDISHGLTKNGLCACARPRIFEGSIQNSQCVVSGAGSAGSSVSDTLTLTLNIMFKAAFTGNRVAYAAGRDSAGGNHTHWQASETFTVQ